MQKSLKILSKIAVTNTLVLAMLCILVGCNSNVMDSGAVEASKNVQDIEIPLNLEAELEEKKREEENEAYIETFLEGLYEEGFISEELKDSSKKRVLPSGMTVIGDAIPAKSYRTLADGEAAYGKYLGLHNKVSDGITDWELIQVVIIDDKILQGTYESSNGMNFNLKLTYPEKGATLSDLISVYDKCDRYDDFEMNECKGKLGYSNRIQNYETIFFIAKNEKVYSIHNASGFRKEAIESLLAELTYNLTIMDDWDN